MKRWILFFAIDYRGFGRKLYDAAQGRKQLLLVEGGSHFSTMAMGQAQYRQALAQLFSLR